jgi:peptidyl-prolyl cis-trans isomerase SurA
MIALRQPRIPTGLALKGWLAICVAVASIATLRAQTADPAIPSSPAVTLDRVVAVVNHQAILSSDLEDEIELSVLDPSRVGLGDLTPQRALQQLISRALIQQQIKQDDIQTADPAPEEVAARLKEIRTELPACVRQNCGTDVGWKAFLDAHDLTPARVETYLRSRLEILRFIEMRFRQGIQIPQEDIEMYYLGKLLPLYPAGQKAPPLEQVAPRIQEILLQQQVNVMFDGWLDNLRKQGEVEVLDPALESAAIPTKSGAASE